MAIAVFLLSSFTAWMIFVYSRGLQIACGCFGTGEAHIGLDTIKRNVFLIVVALTGFLLSLRAQSPFPRPSLWMVATVTSCGLAFMLLQAFWRARPGLILSRPDLERTLREAEQTIDVGESLAYRGLDE